MSRLIFDIRGFWRAGTGRGGGASTDSLVHRDADGLPCLPGRTVKGLLRDAVYRAERWAYVDTGTTERWFGSRVFETNADSDEPISRLSTKAGALIVSDAVVDKAVSDYLVYLKNNDPDEFKKLLGEFFHTVAATAIEHHSSSAKNKSLRTLEVTIPLTVSATLDVFDEIQPNWRAQLRRCLPLIQAVGSSRTRGLGRVQVTLEED